MIVRCVYCHREIDSEASTTRSRVWGWERRRRQGGTNHLELRTPTGEFACEHCIDALGRGINPAQLELTLRRKAKA